ncbi:MAG: hypothetical protein IJ272_02115 [Clostridia bacterium]|nr:hypothetical protein [Clostridia bacterium]
MEEEKKENIIEKLKKEVEKSIETTLEKGILTTNVDFLFKVVDIHKDIANEEYWQSKKEEEDMRYRAYSRGYGENEMGNYGRRMRDSRGRYTARGYDSKYKGEEVLNDMHESYQEYADSQGNMGNYGAQENAIKSLEYMLQSMVDFVEMLKEDASSQEEMNLIKKYTKQISEM